MTGVRRPSVRPRRRRLTRIGAGALLVGTSLSACVGQDLSGASSPAWFGGYDDVMVVEDAAGTPPQTTVLSFVVADPDDPCTPSWAATHDMEGAAASLGLEERIRGLREGGGEVAISFGGAHDEELATVCDDPDRLSAAYAAVIDRYGVDLVDLDVEADDLGLSAANTRRGEALAGLQRERPDDRPLQVWLTLPVDTDGLTDDARAVVAETLAAGVDVTGVNLMTMNFGQGGDDVAGDAEASARAAQVQVKALYAEAGQSLTDEQAWERIGLTPMIGQNDVEGEVLDLEAARTLNRFARDQGAGRVSFWSQDRDRACGPDRDAGQAVHDCSGVEQEPGAFTEALGAGLAPTPRSGS